LIHVGTLSQQWGFRGNVLQSRSYGVWVVATVLEVCVVSDGPMGMATVGFGWLRRTWLGVRVGSLRGKLCWYVPWEACVASSLRFASAVRMALYGHE
jgi:hypothetical protein